MFNKITIYLLNNRIIFKLKIMSYIMETVELNRRTLLKKGLVGLVGGITLASGLFVPQTAVARDEDPAGTMDEPGLHMYICNYIEKEEKKPVGKGKTHFFGEDRIALLMESALLNKKRGWIEILNPHGNRIKSRGYDFKIMWGGEWFSLNSTAKELRENSGNGTYAGKFYFNTKYQKTISFEVR